MDATELGAAIKRLRKNDLRMTQRSFSERTEMDLKKLSRLECGYQLPDEDFWEVLLKIGVGEERINTMRQWTDDARRTQIVKRTSMAPESPVLSEDVRIIKEIVARNNLILRDILKIVRHEANDDLVQKALEKE
jgi:transcriptional regulator with XRE-family HTH domain